MILTARSLRGHCSPSRRVEHPEYEPRLGGVEDETGGQRQPPLRLQRGHAAPGFDDVVVGVDRLLEPLGEL